MPPMCACMSAGRRSTTSPISAMRAPSSCSTCCSGCSATSTGAEHVTYVRNITDVDDKINARAAQDYPGLPLNEAIRRVTEKTEAQFHADMKALGALDPTVEPRATEHIEQMKAMIERLVERGCAYVAEDHVLFDVASMPDYGKLSGRSLDEMIAGARVEVAPYKRDPMDFVLWKPSKPGEPSWPSPAGIAAPGRPGWHIECSAMADRWLWEEAKPTLSTGGARRAAYVRHPWRRHRPRLSPSRERGGAIALRQRARRSWRRCGCITASSRSRERRWRRALGNFVTVHELLEAGRAMRGRARRFASTCCGRTIASRSTGRWSVSMRRIRRLWAVVWRSRRQGALSDRRARSPMLDALLEDDLNTPKAIAADARAAQAAAPAPRAPHASRGVSAVARLLGRAGRARSGRSATASRSLRGSRR